MPLKLLKSVSKSTEFAPPLISTLGKVGALAGESKNYTVTIIDSFVEFISKIVHAIANFFQSKRESPSPETIKTTERQIPHSIEIIEPTEEAQRIEQNPQPKSPKDLAPVGIRNHGANCWANAMLQFIVNAPILVEKILERKNGSCKEIASLIQNYYAAQKEKQFIANIDSQILRAWFNNHKNIPSQINAQVDLADALYLIFDKIDFHFTLFQLYFSPNGEVRQEIRNEPMIMLEMTEGVRSFKNLFAKFFHSKDDKGGSLAIKFEKAPEDFIVSIKRTSNEDITEIPTQFRLPEEYSNMEEANAQYELMSCMIHLGQDNCGHYVTLQKKSDGYYLINDSKVEKISNKKAVQLMKKGFIFHYRKMEEAYPAIELSHDQRQSSLTYLTPVICITALSILGIAALALL